MLVVDGSVWKLDDYISERKGQILEQIRSAESTGVTQMIVVVNKMDLTEPPFCEVRFNVIKTKVTSLIGETSYDPATVPFIPISGRHGDNVLEASANLPWYDGWLVVRREKETKGELAAQDLCYVFN